MKGKTPSAIATETERIANRLRASRLALGLTQVALAKLAGLSRSAVVHYEKGNAVPGALEMIKLASALHRTPNYLLSGSDEYFASKKPEHSLISDQALIIPRITMCLMALSRELQEPISALLLALVQSQKTTEDFTAFLHSIEEVGATLRQQGPQFEALVEDSVQKLVRPKRKR